MTPGWRRRRQRDEALMLALDKILFDVIRLGDSVREAILALNEPDKPVEEIGFELLQNATCTTCGRPAHPHPYRHPVTIVGQERRL